MALLRLALLSTAAIIAIPPTPARAAETSFDAEYIGGTVKTIPVKTLGDLNLQDATELRFRYGTEIYNVPYTQITQTDIGKPEKGKRLFGHVPVPTRMMPGKRHETLMVTYRDAAGAENVLNFDLTAKEALSAKASLMSRTGKPVPERAAATEDSWWGDKYWKTERNLPKWEADAAAGTK